MTQKRKGYDKDFKVNAVKLVLQGGNTMKEVARDLGVNYYSLAKWKEQYEKKGGHAFLGNGRAVYATEAEKEIAELKKKLRHAEMERDLLKKAMAISLREK